MIDEILATRGGGRVRIALREAGRLMELIAGTPEAPGAVGDIVLGRVTAVLKGMEACFVDIGAERAGFLSLAGRPGPGGSPPPEAPGSGRAPLTEGARVLVQVSKAAQMGKGAGLTRNVTLPGRYLVLAPCQGRIAVSRRIADEEARAALEHALAAIAEPGEGFIVRTAAAGADPAALAEDARELRRRWEAIEDAMGNVEPPARLHTEAVGIGAVLRDRAHDRLRRVIVDDAGAAGEARAFLAAHLPAVAARVEEWDGPGALFEALGVEDEIAAALLPEVALPCGGSLVIEETHAANAIDVNTARNTGRSGHAETVLATNIEAAGEIARQLRLRNLGGLTVIDFIHMEDEDHRGRVLTALLDGLADDPAFIRATGFSELGLVELARRRGRGPLAEILEAGEGNEAGAG